MSVEENIRALETTPAERKPAFRWRSRIGVATALFLVLGAVNFSLAIAVPVTLHLLGPATAGGLVLSDDADTAFLGRSLSAVNAADPAMGAYLVTFMDTMCPFMMATAVLQLGVAWFAVRRAQAWGVWAGLLANVAIAPYYLAVGATFAQRGAPFLFAIESILVYAAPAAVATGVGLSGIRRKSSPMASLNASSESAPHESEGSRADRKPMARWRSRLGGASALFLAIGAVNLGFAVAAPVTLHLLGPDAFGFLILSNDADTAFLGRSLSAVNAADPAMGAYLVTFMDTMCAFMMAFAVTEIGVTWFGLRRGQSWAVWVLLIGTVAIVPYYLAVGWTFAMRGVPISIVIVQGLGLILFIAVLTVLAAGLGWSGIRKLKTAGGTLS